jgi:hypothetical protein
MRTKITIALVLLAAVGGITSFYASLAPREVTMTFTGYSNDRSKVLFSIRNNTRYRVAFGGLRVEVRTKRGWEEHFAHSEGCLLTPGTGFDTDGELPAGQTTWRALIPYRFYLGAEASLVRRRAESLLWRVGLSSFDRKHILWAEERTK